MFNDLVIAANRLIAETAVRRILIVDLDVHQGDGTAALTAGRDDIVTFSMHGEKNFPVRKAVSDLDVAAARCGWATTPIWRRSPSICRR